MEFKPYTQGTAMLKRLVAFITRLRPAPLAVLVGTLIGLNRRREYRTSVGRIWLSPLSDLGRRLICHDGYEPSMELFLRSSLSEGETFVDLGANEGYFTILASRLVGEYGKVIAVEPQSRLIPILEKNISINSCANVKIIRAIVSARTGSGCIHLAPITNTGSSSIYRPTKYMLPTENVASLTLGALFELANIQHCDLLKMDVEGAEGEIVYGAQEFLASKAIKTMVVEFHNDMLVKEKQSWEDIHRKIVGSGYQPCSGDGFVIYRSVM